MRRHSIIGGAVNGAIAGGIATYVMDLVTTGVQAQQSGADQAEEKAAQANGKSSVENLLEMLEQRLSFRVSDDMRPMALQALHYALGMAPAMAYGALRDRLPLVGAGQGLAFGLAVWALNDEYMNTALGLSGPPDAYPLSSHVRGLVGHLALGATVDTVLDIV